MKSSLAKRIYIAVIAASIVTSIVIAQPAAAPLDVQGIDQLTINGGRSRAMGGTGVASANDASALFSNPAALSRLSSLEVRASGFFENSAWDQSQEWVPLRNYTNFAIFFEGLARFVHRPTVNGKPDSIITNPWNNLQVQYDDIEPGNNHRASYVRPFSFAAAMPLTLFGKKISAGIGISQVMNLNHYYQNNTALTPHLGQVRPNPQFTPLNDTMHVRFYQLIRKREGTVYGVTPGVSISLLQGLTVGASAAILTGTSDDYDYRRERGYLSVINGNFISDTVYTYETKSGTSNYSGNIVTLGILFQQPRYSVGVTIKPPMTLTRTWDRSVSVLDTSHRVAPIRRDSTRTYKENGKEYLNFPIAYTIGIVLTPTDRWMLAFDYEVRSLADMEISNPVAASTHPWVNSRTIHLGAEYRVSEMLALRGGYREDNQAFSPDGNPVEGDPAVGGIYSVGAGLTLGKIIIDIAYEYSLLKYEDLYLSNISLNTRVQHQFMMEIAYRF